MWEAIYNLLCVWSVRRGVVQILCACALYELVGARDDAIKGEFPGERTKQ